MPTVPPPGAPRKHVPIATRVNEGDASSSTSGRATSYSVATDPGASYDAIASALFNDSSAGPVIEMGSTANLTSMTSDRDPTTWLSRRTHMLPPDSEHRPTSYADTPTGRPQARIPSMASTSTNVFRTPSATGRTQNRSMLYDQLTRGMAASRYGHTNAARQSVASSSGWGSPRVLQQGIVAADEQNRQRMSNGSSASSGPSRIPVTMSRPEGNVFGTPHTPHVNEADASLLRAPAGLPRFSFPRNPMGTNNDAAINTDGSYNVVRDENDANNSGLLALTPAIRRSQAFGMTPMVAPLGKSTKRTSEASDRPGNFTMIEHALDVDGPVQDEQDAADGRAQILQGYTDEHSSPERHRALLEVMRSWREDAMKHHLYDTAIYWGDKILSLETDQIAWNDAYNLATAYFLTHRYAQAEHLLCTPLRLAANRVDDMEAVKSQSAEGHDDYLDMPPVNEEDRGNAADELRAALESTYRSSRLPAVMLNRAKHLSNPLEIHASNTDAKQKGLAVNGEYSSQSSEDQVADAWRQEQRFAMAEIRASHLLPPDSVSLVSISVPCKYLAAQCMVRQGKYQEALDELSGWKGDDADMLEQNYRQPSKDGLIKLSSSIWHLKGLIYLHLRNIDEARESFMRSLSLDVKNYESFDQLIRGHLISTTQQWDFVEHLEYTAQAGDDPAQMEAMQVVKLLYTSRLGKTGKLQAQRTAAARRQLIASYELGSNPDVLLGLAEEMYERMRYEDAYTVTQRIMDLSKDHEVALPVHISSMFMIERLRPSLFLLAHHLTEVDADLPAAWYAVGCWYFGVKRWLEARKHFSKSVQLDPRFAPGWVAFAHTFAYEGESDQAIVSYSTAERNFSANHMIKLFLGMEHLAQGNLMLAELYMTASAEIWEEDALSRNERGVVAYYGGRMHEAIALFRSALQAAQDVQQPPSAWVATHMNLAFALRRTGQTSDARACFLRAIELNPDVGQAYTGVGMCYHRDGDLDEAISWYHRALAVDATDKHANELLSFALQESARHAPAALFRAADRIIEEMGSIKVAGKVSSSTQSAAKLAGLGVQTQSLSNTQRVEYHEETTQHMSLTAGSLSLDMDESV